MNRVVLLVVMLAAACGAAQLATFNSSAIVMNDVRVKVVEGAPKPPTQRIYNGRPANAGQFPYQAAILIDRGKFCGGSLISKKTVLTAAHCIDGASVFQVYLGTNTWQTPGSDSLTVNTRTKVQHNKYNEVTLNNDVGVIKLGEEITLTNTIQPIPLDSSSSLHAGDTAVISGWGKTRDSGSVTSQLMYAELVIKTNQECQAVYGKNVVISSVMCAVGAGMQSTCSGDSGGPLVYKGVQIGIVSFGAAASCEIGYPSGFTRVNSFKGWITKNFATKISLSIEMMLVSYLLLFVGRRNFAAM